MKSLVATEGVAGVAQQERMLLTGQTIFSFPQAERKRNEIRYGRIKNLFLISLIRMVSDLSSFPLSRQYFPIYESSVVTDLGRQTTKVHAAYVVSTLGRLCMLSHQTFPNLGRIPGGRTPVTCPMWYAV